MAPSAATKKPAANVDVMQAVQATVDKHKSEQPTDIWASKLRPGLEFRVRRFSRLALIDAINNIPIPEPPKVFIEDKEVEEDNPNDPVFQREVHEYNQKISILAINVRIAMGTSVHKLPDDLDPPDGTEWPDTLEFIGLQVPTGKAARYAAWVRWYALDNDELVNLQNTVERFNGGTLEADVAIATEEFKSPEERDTDNGAPPTQDG